MLDTLPKMFFTVRNAVVVGTLMGIADNDTTQRIGRFPLQDYATF